MTLQTVHESELEPPHRRWDVMWCWPWDLTRPWLPRWIRGTDEWHNASGGIIIPFVGAVIVYRMRYRRDDPAQHIWAVQRVELGVGRALRWEGLRVRECAFCDEIVKEALEHFQMPL